LSPRWRAEEAGWCRHHDRVRGPRDTALLTDILTIERHEEALITLAAGRPIARRRDAATPLLGITSPPS
jgi:hypothetical protein